MPKSDKLNFLDDLFLFVATLLMVEFLTSLLFNILNIPLIEIGLAAGATALGFIYTKNSGRIMPPALRIKAIAIVGLINLLFSFFNKPSGQIQIFYFIGIVIRIIIDSLLIYIFIGLGAKIYLKNKVRSKKTK